MEGKNKRKSGRAVDLVPIWESEAASRVILKQVKKLETSRPSPDSARVHRGYPGKNPPKRSLDGAPSIIKRTPQSGHPPGWVCYPTLLAMSPWKSDAVTVILPSYPAEFWMALQGIDRSRVELYSSDS